MDSFFQGAFFGEVFAQQGRARGPYGPWPIWALAHMGPGPYGPWPIWAMSQIFIFKTGFIFKPDLALNTSNKLGLTGYKINFEEIDSNNNLLKPSYSLKNIKVNDKNTNELMAIESLKIGINVLKSLSSDLIVINELEIINFTNQIDSKSEGFFSAMIFTFCFPACNISPSKVTFEGKRPMTVSYFNK